jgi:hypothetical protein
MKAAIRSPRTLTKPAVMSPVVRDHLLVDAKDVHGNLRLDA